MPWRWPRPAEPGAGTPQATTHGHQDHDRAGEHTTAAYASSPVSRAYSAGTATCRWIVLGGDTGGGVLAELDVEAEAAQVGVAGLGLQLGGRPSGGCQMRQGSVSCPRTVR